MASIKNAERDCVGLNQKMAVGFMVVSIGASGAPTVQVPVAGITITRASAGVYDFTLPDETIFVLPCPLATNTLVGFRANGLGSQVSCLIESAGTIAIGDPANGDILGFLLIGLLGNG